MGLLDQLWDDTVAGPRPDNGLGKLRKHKTFSFGQPNTPKESEIGNSSSSISEESETVRVTKSIMIMRPPPLDLKDSPPISPAGSTPPVSPFSVGSGGREAFRFRRRSASFAYEKANGVGPRSPPPPYDL